MRVLLSGLLLGTLALGCDKTSSNENATCDYTINGTRYHGDSKRECEELEDSLFGTNTARETRNTRTDGTNNGDDQDPPGRVWHSDGNDPDDAGNNGAGEVPPYCVDIRKSGCGDSDQNCCPYGWEGASNNQLQCENNRCCLSFGPCASDADCCDDYVCYDSGVINYNFVCTHKETIELLGN